jgi:ketosteroid isomerase-like protein
MKKILLLSSVVVIFLIGCQQKEKERIVDLAAVEQTVDEFAEKYYNSLVSKNVDALNILVADDGLFCGTDPSEVFTKRDVIEYWTTVSEDTVNDYSYKVDLRKIKVTPTGQSAIVMEHLTSAMSPLMKITQTYHVVKTNDSWLIDYLSWGFLVKNDDIEKVNAVLMLEE